ncbi:MAG TPA: hypothetical protein PKE03_01110 [Bacteroidales bacterium]|nr:hypothetical protein [Bacteroidales bacterium]
MQSILARSLNTEKMLVALIMLCITPAFFLYLGLQPFIPDEAIRALVAQEMIHSGDYITPTLGGDAYLKKPPLYNWFIVMSFQLSGRQNEFFMRLPMLIFLFLFTFSIFKLLQKERGRKQALLVALLFLTNGRILFYESLHGLIDTAFSWLVFLLFILSYQLMQRRQYLYMYLVSYGLMALGYLMKGLPSLVFIGITMLVLHAMHRKLKMLFSWQHLIGIAFMALILGSYYLAYFSRNPIAPGEVFSVLLGETTRRTALRFGWWAMVKNIFVFPFNMFYHFLPWSILVIPMLNKKVIRALWNDHFMRYCALIILFNIIPYWLSPEVHPRYVLMFVPLYLTMAISVYYTPDQHTAVLTKWIERVFGIVLILASILVWTPVFIEPTRNFDHILLISLSLFVALALVTLAYYRLNQYRLLLLVLAMLIVRIGLNLTVLPARALLATSFESRRLAQQTAALTQGSPLYVWWNPEKKLDPYYGRKRTAYSFMVYANAVRGDRVEFSSTRKEDAYYLARKTDFSPREAYVVKRLYPAEEAKDLYLIKFFPHAVD